MKDFEDANVDLFISYGINDLEKFEKWLLNDVKNHLIIIEDEKKNFENILKQKFYKKFSKNFQIDLLFNENMFDETFIKKIAWKFAFFNERFVKHPKKSYQNFNKFEKILKKYLLASKLIISEKSDFGISSFENFLKNLKNVGKSYSGNLFKNSFKNIPAIICGAGSSIENFKSFLKNAKNNAMIFAGGSAVNILSDFSIKPHFSSYIDSNSPFSRMKLSNFFDNFSLFSFDAENKNLLTSHSEKVMFQTTSNSLFQDFFLNSLGILNDEKISAGWDVSSFLISIATFLGCSPIILIGVDLAYNDGEKYANDLKTTDRENETKIIEVENLQNKKVNTQEDWLFSKNWIEDFIKNSSSTFYNFSKNGLKIDGAINKIVKLSNQIDIESIIHTHFQNTDMKSFEEKEIFESLELIEKSMDRCFFKLQKLIDNLSEKNMSNLDNLVENYFKEIKFENFNKIFLEPIVSIWYPTFEIKMKKELLGNFSKFLNKIFFLKDVLEKFMKKIKDLKNEKLL